MIYSVSTNKDNISKLYVAGRLEWTSEPPTQEGWYWVCVGDEIFMVEVAKDLNGILMAYIGEYPNNLSYYNNWLGPLPEPEKPE